tara:strand:- start:8653 stop:9846 length:1194 start_codon:yes stop_codon:yes gene_type:complete
LKNILIISPHFFPENFIINEISSELSDDYSITVLTSQPSYPEGKIFEKYNGFSFQIDNFKGIKVLRVPTWPRKQTGIKFIDLILNYTFYLFFGFIRFLLIRKKMDHIFIFGVSPLFSALIPIVSKKILFKKYKITLWVQDLWPQSIYESGYLKNNFARNFFEFCMRIIYKNCDLILSQSSALKNYIISKYQVDNVELVHNPSFDFMTSTILLNNQSKKILYAGNLGNFQCIEELLSEISLCESENLNIEFLIAGDGPYKEKVQQAAKRLKNLSYLGYMNQKDLVKKIESVDFLILGLRESEVSKLIIPSKFQAYLSSSKPVIVSAGKELANIITKNNLGYTFSFLKERDLLNLINDKILNISYDEYLEKSSNCRKYFEENYTINSISEKIKFLLNRT